VRDNKQAFDSPATTVAARFECLFSPLGLSALQPNFRKGPTGNADPIGSCNWRAGRLCLRDLPRRPRS
jgi:hypothetical protein